MADMKIGQGLAKQFLPPAVADADTPLPGAVKAAPGDAVVLAKPRNAFLAGTKAWARNMSDGMMSIAPAAAIVAAGFAVGLPSLTGIAGFMGATAIAGVAAAVGTFIFQMTDRKHFAGDSQLARSAKAMRDTFGFIVAPAAAVGIGAALVLSGPWGLIAGAAAGAAGTYLGMCVRAERGAA